MENGDQLDKTLHLLNNLDNTHVVKVKSQPDGVDVYKIDLNYIVVYHIRAYCGYHPVLEKAEAVAAGLVAKQNRTRKL